MHLLFFSRIENNIFQGGIFEETEKCIYNPAMYQDFLLVHLKKTTFHPSSCLSAYFKELLWTKKLFQMPKWVPRHVRKCPTALCKWLLHQRQWNIFLWLDKLVTREISLVSNLSSHGKSFHGLLMQKLFT